MNSSQHTGTFYCVDIADSRVVVVEHHVKMSSQSFQLYCRLIAATTASKAEHCVAGKYYSTQFLHQNCDVNEKNAVVNTHIFIRLRMSSLQYQVTLPGDIGTYIGVNNLPKVVTQMAAVRLEPPT